MNAPLNSATRRFCLLLATLCLLAAGLVGAAREAVAGPIPACATGTLSDYINAFNVPGGGCMVGSLEFGAFSYHPVSNAPLASGIRVDPAASGAGLSFATAGGAPFSAPSGAPISFEIDLSVSIDPAAPVTEAGMDLTGFTGTASALEYLCGAQAYVYTGACASSAPSSFTVGGSGGAGSPAFATLPFGHAVTGTQNAGLLVTIGAAGDAGSIDALTVRFTGVSAVPEPASWATMLVGLCSLLGAAGCAKSLHRGTRSRGRWQASQHRSEACAHSSPIGAHWPTLPRACLGGALGQASFGFDGVADARGPFVCVHLRPNEWKGLPRPELAAQRRPATQCHDGKCEVSSTHSEGEVMSILYVGIDLAKNVFAVHGVDEFGTARLHQPKFARAKLHALIASLPPCVIGMEACSGAHHWARLLQAHGHAVRLMAPKFVAPYRMSGKQGKNDAAGAAAICEAV